MDKAIVTLIRNKKLHGYYYIRLDDKETQATAWINKLITQFDFDVELGIHIVFEEEISEILTRPAKQNAEKFIEYLKTIVATEFKEEYFVSNWYKIDDISNPNKWKIEFHEYDKQQTLTLLKITDPKIQTSLF